MPHQLLSGFGPLIVLAVIGFGVVGVIAVRVGRRNKQRVAELRDWALSQDFSFSEREEFPALPYQGPPFDLGNRRRYRNLIRGRLAGLPLTAFDYSYETTSSRRSGAGGTVRNTSTHHLQVIAVDLPARRPRLSVTPKSLASRIAVVFGGQDIQIGLPDFDRTFRVRADDQQAARSLLGPLAPALLAWPDQALRIEGSGLLVYRRGRLEAQELERRLKGLAAALIEAGSVTPPDDDQV
jgi:hypothetical protein